MAGTAYAQFKGDGNSIDYTPTAAVVASQVVVINDLIGIAAVDIAANAPGSLRVKGLFDFPQNTGVIANGSDMFWDESEAVATTDDDSGANLWIGKSVKAAVDGDTTVRVMLEYCPDSDYTGAHTAST